jgi:vacuolar protein sorting-associated protein 13A/C
MAAIRIVPIEAVTDSRQLQFQSARTRCANPSKYNGTQLRVFWDEVFVFEVKSGVCVLPAFISFLFGPVVMII